MRTNLSVLEHFIVISSEKYSFNECFFSLLFIVDIVEISTNDMSTAKNIDESGSKNALRTGRSYAKDGKYSEAITDLNKAAQLNPTNPEAYYYLGLVYLKKQQYSDAVAVLKKAVDNNTDTNKKNITHYYYKYAFACQMSENFDEALKYYTKFIENTTNENKYPGLLNRGICNDNLKKYSEALSDFNWALEITNEEGRPYCLSCRARVKAKMSDQKGALEDYDKAVGQTAAFVENAHVSKKEKESRLNLLASYSILLPDSSAIDILVKSLQSDDAYNSVDAMNGLNKLLEEPAVFHEQIQQLNNQLTTETNPMKRQSIENYLAIAQMAVGTVDKHSIAFETFSKNENLKTYYSTIYFKLEEIFSASKTVASGLVTPTSGKLGQWNEYISLAGEIISIVPCVGEPLNYALKPVNFIVKEIDYQRRKNTMTRIARLGTTLQLWEHCQEVAETLTKLYKPLLSELIELNSEDNQGQKFDEKDGSCCYGVSNWAPCKYFRKCKQAGTKELQMTAAECVADYAVGLILEFLLNLTTLTNSNNDTTQQTKNKSKNNDENEQKSELAEDSLKTTDATVLENEKLKRKQNVGIDPKKSLDKQLVEIVCTPSKPSIIKEIKSRLGKKEIPTKNPKKRWTLDGFYQARGIITPQEGINVLPE